MPVRNLDAQHLEDYKVDYAERTEWEMPRSDFHEHYEIFFALSDGVSCFVDGNLYAVRRGDVFLFPPHVLHRTVAWGETVYRRYVVSFREEWIVGFIPSLSELLAPFSNPSPVNRAAAHLEESQAGELLALIDKLERCGEGDGFCRDIRRKLAFAELLLYICAAFRSAGTMETPSAGEECVRIQAVAQYIRENLGPGLTLDRLAERFFIGKSYLCRLFKQYTGYTINEYATGMRLMKARELLASNTSVMQACEQSGFGDYSHFIRTFSRHMGISPKQYAKTANAASRGN